MRSSWSNRPVVATWTFMVERFGFLTESYLGQPAIPLHLLALEVVSFIHPTQTYVTHGVFLRDSYGTLMPRSCVPDPRQHTWHSTLRGVWRVSRTLNPRQRDWILIAETPRSSSRLSQYVLHAGAPGAVALACATALPTEEMRTLNPSPETGSWWHARGDG